MRKMGGMTDTRPADSDVFGLTEDQLQTLHELAHKAPTEHGYEQKHMDPFDRCQNLACRMARIIRG